MGYRSRHTGQRFFLAIRCHIPKLTHSHVLGIGARDRSWRLCNVRGSTGASAGWNVARQPDAHLTASEYNYGSERGHWSADRSSFRYVKADDTPAIGRTYERCSFSIIGRALVLTDCRMAGRYTRMQ